MLDIVPFLSKVKPTLFTAHIITFLLMKVADMFIKIMLGGIRFGTVVADETILLLAPLSLVFPFVRGKSKDRLGLITTLITSLHHFSVLFENV